MPRVLVDDKVYVKPDKVLSAAYKAWSKYFKAEDVLPTEDWKEHYVNPLPVRARTMGEVTPDMLIAALRSAKKGTAPSTDSWRMEELAALPREAMVQLSQLFGKMESQGRVPDAMRTSWTALTSKTASPAPPEKLRPIAVLSAVWRLYGMARLAEMREQILDIMPPQIHAYVPGRSAEKAAMGIIEQLERAKYAAAVGQEEAWTLIGLDASKAFPSIARSQLYELMNKVGIDTRLAGLLRSFYEGKSWYRIGGQYCHDTAHCLGQGVHQGCPISVLLFNLVQLPLLQQIVGKFDKVYPTIFADDILLLSRDAAQLQRSLDLTARYMNSVCITLNPSKTRVWSSQSGDAPTLYLSGIELPESHVIDILGMKLEHTKVSHRPQGSKEKKETYAAALVKVHKIPLTLAAKQLAFAGITMASLLYSPYNMAFNRNEVLGLRNSVIATLRPSLQGTARSQAMVTLFCLHGHRIDPILAVLWRLLMLIQHYKADLENLDDLVAYGNWGPLAQLARQLTLHGATIVQGCAHFPHYEPIELRRPIETVEYRAWQHGWRERLRDLLLRESVMHRSDYATLKGVFINWKVTMDLHHKLGAKPVLRTYLEVILSGALLTRSRTMKRSECKRDRWCPYGCKAEDTAYHRFWKCQRWMALRMKWISAEWVMAPITRHVGLIPDSSDLEQAAVHSIQTFMALVAYETVLDNRTKASREHMGDCESSSEILTDQPCSAMASDAICDGAGLSGGRSSGSSGGRGHCSQKVLGVLSQEPTRNAKPCEKPGGSAKRHHAHTRVLPPLPPHITVHTREVLGSKHAPKRVLKCNTCGGSGLDNQYTRFLANHATCVAGLDPMRRPKRILTRVEREALEGVAGAAEVASKAKRLKTTRVLPSLLKRGIA